MTTFFHLKPVKMSREEKLLSKDTTSVNFEESELQRSHSSPPPSIGTEKERPNEIKDAASFSTSPNRQALIGDHLRRSSQAMAVSRDRATWGGLDEYGKRSPTRIPSRRGQEGEIARSPRHYQEYIPAGGMYVLYEDPGQDLPRTRGPSRESTIYTPSEYQDDDSVVTDGRQNRRARSTNTFIGEIDGRFSFSEYNVDDYVRVDVNAEGSSTSIELLQCKKTVLKPYLLFLKVIGWRRLRESNQDLSRSTLSACFNFAYPLFLFLVLLGTIILQNFTCYYRTHPAYFPEGNNTFIDLHCTDHLIVEEIIPGLLILGAYLYGVYIFRYGEPEHLTTLIETVFLSYSQISGNKKGIIRVLRYFLIFGVLWILLDIAMNVLRLISLQLLEEQTFIEGLLIPVNRTINSTSHHSTEENIIRYVCVLLTLIGFIFFDLLYFAVVVTYVSQSQLIQYYVLSIMAKVRARAYGLEDAIKDIRQTYTYLAVINRKLSTLTTLVLFIFIGSVLSSIYNLALYPEEDKHNRSCIFYIGVVVGVGNIIQWSLLAAAPIAQAARLTSKCRQLRRLGLEIASRPYVYNTTPQLDLGFFLQYTNATRYTAKLASIPIYPSFVVGFLFFGGIIGCFVISIHHHFLFARWF